MILRNRSSACFFGANKLLLFISTLLSTSSLLIETVEGLRLNEEAPIAGQKQLSNVQQTTGRHAEQAARAIGMQFEHDQGVEIARDLSSADRELLLEVTNSNITLQSYQVNAIETTTTTSTTPKVVEQARQKPKNNLRTTITEDERSKSNSRQSQQQEKPRHEETKLTPQVTTKTLTEAKAATTLDSTITNLQNQHKKHLILPANSPSNQTRNLSKVEKSDRRRAHHAAEAHEDGGEQKILVPFGTTADQRTVGRQSLASSSAEAKNNSIFFSASTSDTTKVATEKLEPRRRWPRLAQELSTTPARQPEGASSSPLASGAAIQALLGERLTIPCSNLSLLMASEGTKPDGQAIVSGSGGLLYSSSWQPHRQLNSRRFGNGLQAGGASGGAPLGSQHQQANNRPLVANGQGIALIVWHKDEQLDSPIFSADARGVSSLREAKQQTGADGSLRGRAHLEESTRVDSRGKGLTPALVIDEASSADAGLYTCTVEFHKAPTQTHQVRVLLINPPKNMAITVQDDSGLNQPLLPGIIGPYDEDSQLAFNCEVEPGDPAGHLGWWQLKSTSIPVAAAVTTTIPSNQQQQRNASQLWQKQPRPLVPIEKAEFLTTLDIGDEGDGEKDAREQFVAFHQSSHEFSTVGNSLASHSGANRRQRLKHWVRVGSKQESTLASVSSDSLVDNRNFLKVNLQLTLTRSTLDNEYLCLARNSEFVAPLNSSIKVNLNLKPTGVRIVNKENLIFKLGQKVTIECHVYGSKPEPKVSWLNGTEELESQTTSKANRDHQHLSVSTNSLYDAHSTRATAISTTIVTTSDGDSASNAQNYISEINRDINNNLTKISYLTLVPQLSHNQQQLTCSASNSKMPNLPAISDSITMNVQFPAQLNLQFGAGIKPDSIKLGSDVFMDCNIQSNPPTDDLIWLFNDQPLQPQANSGIIMSNQSLVLQRVRIEHRGVYQCLARNSVGKSQSNKLYLKPKFEPVCDYSLTKTKYEVAVNHAVRVECNVLAEPNEDIHFVWRFNQTSSSASFAGDDHDNAVHHHLEDIKHYETNFTKSYVMFTPKSRKNYGQLLCSGSNSMGMQEKACAIQIVPSELPEPVFGCFFDNKTNNSFSVHCQTPQSSSSRQSYLLELYTNEPAGQSSPSSNSDNNNNLDPLSSFSSHSQRHSTPTTHLRQRQQDNNPDDDDDTTSNDGANSDIPVTNQNNEQSNEQHQLQHQVRSVRSDSPSFHMVELKPNTSYNVIIYVQNSKGRSAPAFYQANTLSDVTDNDDDPSSIEFSSSSSTAKVQLINNNKRISIWPSGDDQNPFDRIVSFIGDSLGISSKNVNRSDNYKLILRVALLVLMGTISIVIITFFVSRACVGGAKNRKQHQGHQERRRSRNSVGPSGLRAEGDDESSAKQKRRKRKGDDGGGDEFSNSSQHQKQSARGACGLQLTATSNPISTLNRLKNLTGNGSDTSRETNTDSTLLSSSRTGGGEGDVSSVGGSGGQAQIKVPSACGIGTNFLSQTPSPMLRASSIHEEQQARSVLQQKIYSNELVRRSNLVQSPLELEQQNPNTPQISIHSGTGGSDCTTSNNGELMQADGLDAQQFHPYLVKCLDNSSPNEPVYVITASGNSRRGFVTHEPSSVCDRSAYLAGSQQLRLLNPNNLWPYQLREDACNFVDAATHGGCGQVNSIGTTTDSCEVSTPTTSHSNGFRTASAAMVEGQPPSNELAGSQMQFGFLPSSMSIPVSLSDCNQLRSRNLQHHRLSQDLVAETEDLRLTNSAEVASYLTLAPGDNSSTIGFGQQHSYGGSNDQRLKEHLALAGIPAVESHFQCSVNKDGCYCTQTLDNSHLRAQALRMARGRVTNRTFDPKRASFDGNFPMGDSILQQQPTQRHHVKFETRPVQQANIYSKELDGGPERFKSQMITTQGKSIDVNQQQQQLQQQ